MSKGMVSVEVPDSSKPKAKQKLHNSPHEDATAEQQGEADAVGVFSTSITDARTQQRSREDEAAIDLDRLDATIGRHEQVAGP